MITPNASMIKCINRVRSMGADMRNISDILMCGSSSFVDILLAIRLRQCSVEMQKVKKTDSVYAITGFVALYPTNWFRRIKKRRLQNPRLTERINSLALIFCSPRMASTLIAESEEKGIAKAIILKTGDSPASFKKSSAKAFEST